MSDRDYPLPAFFFKVEFTGLDKNSDTSFQEVSGIKATLETEPYTELGEAGSVYRLPKSVSYTNITLKRGVASETSPLVLWCRSIFSGNFTELIEPMTLLVSLMNEERVPVRTWSFANAYPLSWEVGGFNSTENKVAIETIELKYDYFDIIL